MTVAVTVEGLSKSYGGLHVLRDVTFSVSRGEAVALIGPNGAGKTTLLRLLVGALQPEQGEVRIEGELVPRALFETRVAYFAGEFTLPPAVPVRAWRTLFQEPLSQNGDERRLGLLSRGTRQMAGLRIVFSLPALRLIVLDEPWEGLDPDAARWLGEAVRARRETGTALILSSHRLHDLAGLCDRYLFLSRGQVVSFTALELARDGDVTADTLFSVFDRILGGKP